jgi:hypothetical protein
MIEININILDTLAAAFVGGNVEKNAIVKLEYSGDRYWEVGRYEFDMTGLGIT